MSTPFPRPEPAPPPPAPVPFPPKPVREPDPPRLPDEEPLPNPDESDDPPKHVREDRSGRSHGPELPGTALGGRPAAVLSPRVLLTEPSRRR